MFTFPLHESRRLFYCTKGSRCIVHTYQIESFIDTAERSQMFTFRSFSRYIQGESQDTAQPTSPATQAWTSQSARKRNLDACIGPSDGPNKRRSPSTREEPVTAAPLDVTPEPDDDYLCRPDPEKNWGDHRWDSRIVRYAISCGICHFTTNRLQVS